MDHLTIDKKKYVLIPVEDFQELQKKAALKVPEDEILSTDQARIFTKSLINKWASEK